MPVQMVRQMMSDLFQDDDVSLESVDDAETSQSDLNSAVLYHTDWTVETIVHQIKKNRINLSPKFQRREAWGLKAKSLLIESIILNFPIPAVTLAEKKSDGTFIVVDGKQRLTCISQFLGELKNSQFNDFKLTGLTQLSNLNGQSYKELCLNYPKESASLENYSIRTNVIRGWRDDTVLFSIFHRLNAGSVKLSPQELRQSLHPGPFINFISDYCVSSPALRNIFPGDEPDFRMRDIELAIRFIGLALFIQSYSGDLKRHLDNTVSKLNSEWGTKEAEVRTALGRLEDGHNACLGVFGPEGVYRKWNPDGWETRTNRAVFDAVMFALLSDATLDSFKYNPKKVLEIFKYVSADEMFRDAIEKTTKTTEALFNRIHLFCAGLNESGIEAPKLYLHDNKIIVDKI